MRLFRQWWLWKKLFSNRILLCMYTHCPCAWGTPCNVESWAGLKLLCDSHSRCQSNTQGRAVNSCMPSGLDSVNFLKPDGLLRSREYQEWSRIIRSKGRSLQEEVTWSRYQGDWTKKIGESFLWIDRANFYGQNEWKFIFLWKGTMTGVWLKSRSKSRRSQRILRVNNSRKLSEFVCNYKRLNYPNKENNENDGWD